MPYSALVENIMAAKTYLAGRVSVAVAAAALFAAPAQAETVDAGALRAVVQAEPFSLSFTDASGREVLGGGALPGGDRATNVHREGDELVATVGSLTLRVGPAGDGVIRVRTTGDGLSFAAAPGEVFSGFGERSNLVDFRGHDVLDYVADGPYQEQDRQFPKAASPPWGARDRDDDTYFPVPWLLSSRGYGVLLGNDEESTFDLASSDPGRWSAKLASGALDALVFAGPRPADALRRMTALSGRQPPAPAPWAYGPWFQTGQPNTVPLAEEAQIVKTFRDADAPVSAAETQMHFLPCGAQRGNEAYERARTAQFHAAGLAHLVYFNPHLCASYQPVFDEATRAGVLQRDSATGRPWTYPAFVGGSGPAGFTEEPIAQFDFTAPGAEPFYERLVREATDQGVDGWMEDFGEYTPPFIAAADGTPATQAHNRYPRDYHCAVDRIARRVGRPMVRFQRSGWTGAARCAVDVWGGDPTTVWGFDGLQSAVRQALTIGMSGVARWGSDIGGYTTFGPGEQLTRELLHRWIELGAVSGVMRTKRSGLAFPSYTRPQVFDRESLPVWRRYAKLHTQLNPYLQGADADYRATGMPLMRHGLLTDPGDPRAIRADDQFELGHDLLAAPVTVAGARERKLYAPAGAWVDWWRSVRMDAGGAFLPQRPRVLEGGRDQTLPAPEDELPLLARAGAVLPLLDAGVDTLAPYRAPGVTTADERADRLTLLAFPRGRWTGRLGARGRLGSTEGRHRRWVLSISGERPRTYTVRAALGTLRHLFRPRRVTVNGRRLRGWHYDRATTVLTATVHARGRAIVRVTRR
jgi:alpha-glucosidase (family GH31 glycosyl hydrolase)